MSGKVTAKVGRHLTVILGPPGTGKTTKLIGILQGLMEANVPPQQIAFVSYTKAACIEARERAAKKLKLTENDTPWFRTIHSMALYLLNLKPVMFDGRHPKGVHPWAEFQAKYRYDLSPTYEVSGDEPAEMPTETADDQIRSAIQWGRHRRLSLSDTLRLYPSPVPAIRARQYHADFNDFKRETGYMDFEDMPEQALLLPDKRPNVSVAIIDEAQDLSPLLHSAASHWFMDAEQVFVAGDDDQAIYGFQGADPEWLMGLHAVADVREQLQQSYRIPSSVHALAERIIAKNKLRVRKVYRPREERGHLFFVNTIDRAFERVNEANGGTAPGKVFVLARNWKQLYGPIAQALDAQIPFGVPRKRGLSPLDRADIQGAVRAASALREDREVEPKDFAALLEFIPSRGLDLLPHGIKEWAKQLENVPFSRADLEFTAGARKWDLSKLFATLQIEGPVGLLIQGVESGRKMDPQKWGQWKEYLAALLARYGHLPPRAVWFSSSHSVKGAEADVVILLSEMGRLSHKELESGRTAAAEAEHRVAYVAVTRARNGLIVVAPQTNRAFPFEFYMRGLTTDGGPVRTPPLAAIVHDAAVSTRKGQGMVRMKPTRGAEYLENGALVPHPGGLNQVLTFLFWERCQSCGLPLQAGDETGCKCPPCEVCGWHRNRHGAFEEACARDEAITTPAAPQECDEGREGNG